VYISYMIKYEFGFAAKAGPLYHLFIRGSGNDPLCAHAGIPGHREGTEKRPKKQTEI
jgi:hypothetical protein